MSFIDQALDPIEQMEQRQNHRQKAEQQDEPVAGFYGGGMHIVFTDDAGAP